MRLDIVSAERTFTPETGVEGQWLIRGARRSSIIRDAAATISAALLLAPFLVVGVALALEPNPAHTARLEIISAAQLAAGCLIALIWFGSSATRCMTSRPLERTILCQDGQITINDRRNGRAEQNVVPLDAFFGIAHRVRTSLSTSRHEVWLLHAEPSKSYPVLIDTMITDQHVANIAQEFGKPIVPFAMPRTKPHFASVWPQLGAMMVKLFKHAVRRGQATLLSFPGRI